MPRTFVHANEATAAQRRVYFDLRDATDGLTAETGEGSGQPQISTNGGSWTNTGIGTLTHIGNGRYYADLTQSAVATAGDLIETRYKSANTAETPGDSIQVVAFDPTDAVRLGLTALPNAAADAAGGLPISDAGGLDLDTRLGRLDAAISSRLADADYTPPDNSSIASILQDTDADLPTLINARTLAAADYATAAGVAAIETDTQDIQNRLPAALVSGRIDANVGAISDDSDASDTLETMLDGTGGGTLTLNQLRINSNAAGGGIDIDNSGGPGIDCRTSGTSNAVTVRAGGGNGSGLSFTGFGSGAGVVFASGSTGSGVQIVGGSTSGDGVSFSTSGTGKALGDSVVSAFWAFAHATVAALGATTFGQWLYDQVAAVKAKTDNLPASPAATGDAMTLEDGAITAAKVATGAIDADALAADAAQEIADALLDRASAIDGYSPRQILRLVAAVLAGEISGAATSTVTIRDVADTKTRVTATTDSDGNRTAVSYDLT